MLPQKPKCVCEERQFDEDVEFYYFIGLDYLSDEDGCAFVRMKANYCPECGKKLPEVEHSDEDPF